MLCSTIKMKVIAAFIFVGATLGQSSGPGGLELMGEGQTGVFGSGSATAPPGFSIGGIVGMLGPVLGMNPDTTGGSGPYKASAGPVPGLARHTLYQPKSAPERIKLPAIVWGNGACSGNGQWFSKFLTEISSHGYFIIGKTIQPRPI
jgi:hypothetical protein